MNDYELYLDEAYKNNIHIEENYNFKSERIKGLYCDRVIALNKNITTNTEKSCILAEELGHYHTTVGNILDQTNISNRKQELKARLWAYDKQVGLIGIIEAYKNRCQSVEEIADFLGVTEEFFLEALDCYRKKYGVCKSIDNYTIYFEPSLGVMESF